MWEAAASLTAARGSPRRAETGHRLINPIVVPWLVRDVVAFVPLLWLFVVIRRYGLALVVIALVACVSPTTLGPTASAVVVPSAVAAAPSGSPSPSVAPSATASPVPAFPDIELLAGTAGGELMLYSGGAWTTIARICPGPSQNGVTSLFVSADSRTVFVECFRPAVASTDPDARGGFVYDRVTKQARAVAGVTAYGIGPLSPDGRSIVLAERGDCPMPAPVCQTKRSLLDLSTGQEQELLPSDYWLSTEFRWTDLGLVYFRPECADAGCTSAVNAGTFLFAAGKWTKFAQDRLVTSRGATYHVLERRRAISAGERNPSKILDLTITATGRAERVLTPSSVDREFVVGLAGDGSVVAWRPDDPVTPFQGSVVIYRGGSETRSSRGRFSTFLASGTHDVFVGVELSGAPSPTILAYSVINDAFSRMAPPFALSTLVVIPK